MKNGIYIYGIIKTSNSQEFGAIGIGDQPTSVATLAFKDIAAVISESPFTTYDSLAKEKTVKDLVAHQFVLEKVMASFTVLPVKFGPMVESADQAINFLEKRLCSAERRTVQNGGKNRIGCGVAVGDAQSHGGNLSR